MVRILVLGLFNLLRLPFLPLWWIARAISRPRARWVKIRLRPRIVELSGPAPFFVRWLPHGDRLLPTSLARLRELAHTLAADPRIEGSVWVIPRLQLGWGRARSLRAIFASLRAAGKEVVAYLPHGGSNLELYVALAADRILLGPGASFVPLGLSLEARYLHALLDKLGIEVEAFRRAEYKTAVETSTRDSMSDEQRRQLTELLQTFHRELHGAVRDRIGSEAADVFLGRGMQRAENVVRAGVAEGTCYEDELPIRMRPEKVKFIAGPRYMMVREATFFRSVFRKPYIGVVALHGVIGEPSMTGLRPGTLESTLDAIRTVRKDRRALGVIFYVNSPGGSALSSDIIHHEVQRLRETKPVVVYFGDVAASGGYYVAAGADCIVAQATTVTGSIGVISAKIVAKDLFAKIGIRTETVKTEDRADLFSLARRLDDSDRELFDQDVEGFYRAFLKVVASGRQRDVEEVHELARGRVWSGERAAELGLVDRIGDFGTALDEIRSRMELPVAAQKRLKARAVVVRRRDLPPPEPTTSVLGAIPELATLWRLSQSGERVLCLMPYSLRIK